MNKLILKHERQVNVFVSSSNKRFFSLETTRERDLKSTRKVRENLRKVPLDFHRSRGKYASGLSFSS